MICIHCRKEFSEDESAKGCQSCGLFGGCHLLKCPHCNYEQPREPGVVKWFRKRLHHRHRYAHADITQQVNADGVLPLSALAIGEAGYIHSLMINDQKILRKLMSLGLLPAVHVKLMQKYPAYVLQIGYTQIAIDRALANAVKVTVVEE